MGVCLQVEGMRKAYAEIMLNMAQESAARVLAAERRAAALAGGLAAAREDGVAALVRLKAIMEARVRHAPPPPLPLLRFFFFACSFRWLVGWLVGCFLRVWLFVGVVAISAPFRGLRVSAI